MPSPTGIWYHWILLLRSASPSRCENRGRLPDEDEDEYPRTAEGVLRAAAHRRFATVRIVGGACAAPLAQRAWDRLGAWLRMSRRGKGTKVVIVHSRLCDGRGGDAASARLWFGYF